MQVTLAKHKKHEFKLNLPFKTDKEMSEARKAYKLKHFPDRNPRTACYEFYLEYCSDDIKLMGVDYIKPNKALTEEMFIRLYGKEEGMLKWKEKREKDSIKGTKEYYISKYGEEEGIKRWLDKNSKLSVGIDALTRNGKSSDEIKEIKQKHRMRSASISLNACVKRYGSELGHIKYNEYKNTHRSHWRLQYWTDRGHDIAAAKEIISNLQKRDLKYFINKYGEDVGLEKYTEFSKKRLKGLKTACCGISSYENDILSHTSELSPISQYVAVIDKKAIQVDIFYPSLNLIVEVFGDYWHCNPSEFLPEDIHPTYKTPVKMKWDSDKKRINMLKKNHNVMIIWESEFKRNKESIYENIKNYKA